MEAAEGVEDVVEEEARTAKEFEVGIGGGAGIEVARAGRLSGRKSSGRGTTRFKEAVGTTSMRRSGTKELAEAIVMRDKLQERGSDRHRGLVNGYERKDKQEGRAEKRPKDNTTKRDSRVKVTRTAGNQPQRRRLQKAGVTG